MMMMDEEEEEEKEEANATADVLPQQTRDTPSREEIELELDVFLNLTPTLPNPQPNHFLLETIRKRSDTRVFERPSTAIFAKVLNQGKTGY